jgi:hypothetical protein
MTVTIPESHGMPAARLNLVREGTSWKIDVPDDVDAQKLSQNLQQQLQQCVQMKDQWPADATQAQQQISHAVFIALAEPSAGAAGANNASGVNSASGANSGSSAGGSSGATGTSSGTSGAGGAGSSGTSGTSGGAAQ